MDGDDSMNDDEEVYEDPISKELLDLNYFVSTRCDEIMEMVEALIKERDEWKNIATRLFFGAEQQIDELRGLRVPYNKAWHDAWDAYDEAIERGR